MAKSKSGYPSSTSLAALARGADPLRQARDAMDPPGLRALREKNDQIREALNPSGLRAFREKQDLLQGALRTAREASRAIDNTTAQITGTRGRFGSPEYPALDGLLSGFHPPRGRPIPATRIVSTPSLALATAAAEAGTDRDVRSVQDIGDLVRTARKRMRLNQRRFADLAGVGRRFLSELEAGKPTLEIGKVLAVCKAAGIDLTASPR